MMEDELCWHGIIQTESYSTTTKIICRNISIFFRAGPKRNLLLQIEWGYCSNRLATGNPFVWAGHPSPAPKNGHHFQGRVRGWPAPRNAICRGQFTLTPATLFSRPGEGVTRPYKWISKDVSSPHPALKIPDKSYRLPSSSSRQEIVCLGKKLLKIPK